MGDIDRKFLGLPGKKAVKQESLIKTEAKQEDPADMIDFDVGEEWTREGVFRPDPDKLEHREDIEDRFLLAINRAASFDM
jgi:hypothetical protein